MAKTYFTKEHEWIAVEGDVGTVGITTYAREQLGEVAYVELPDVGRTVKAHGDMAVVESSKAASDVYAPVSGEIVEANQTIVDDNAIIDADPEGAGWFVKIRLSDATELEGLMDLGAYKTLIGE
jgi:glycine cleavage system H protein